MSQTKVEAPFVDNNNVRFKNLIINGDMQIAQRATAATASGGNNIAYTTLDRFGFFNSLNGGYTSAQTALSVADQATTGQVKTLDIQCTTADTSILAGDYAAVQQNIEAQNCQHLLWGTSAAKKLTVSFYIKSNLTGTTCGTIVKNDSTTYYYPFEFTINSANTWEKKSVVIEPDSNIQASAGAITNDNGIGLQLRINLTLGSNLTGGTNRTWTTSEKYATSNQLNFLSSTDNDLFLTGVQLEVGDQATDFEYLPFDVQLQRCQRYFYKESLYTAVGATGHVGCGQCNATTRCDVPIRFPVFMRAIPTFSDSSADDFRLQHGGTLTVLSSFAGEGDGVVPFVSSSMLYCTVSSGLTAGNAANLIHNNTAATFQFDAEL